jgi:hypothetical protein
MASPSDPASKKILFVLLISAILMVGLIVYAGITFISNPVPGKSSAPTANTPANPATVQQQDLSATAGTNQPVPSPISTRVPDSIPATTVASTRSPITTSVISGQPDVTYIPVPATPGDSTDIITRQPFTLSVSPASATGKPGDTISYTLRIDGGEGQTEPIHFSLTAGALFFSQTYDLGDENPPFPKTSVYQFTIPTNIPSGITINGVVTATGAGQVREQAVTLKVL